jgi:hypothetical protein
MGETEIVKNYYRKEDEFDKPRKFDRIVKNLNQDHRGTTVQGPGRKYDKFRPGPYLVLRFREIGAFFIRQILVQK